MGSSQQTCQWGPRSFAHRARNAELSQHGIGERFGYEPRHRLDGKLGAVGDEGRPAHALAHVDGQVAGPPRCVTRGTKERGVGPVDFDAKAREHRLAKSHLERQAARRIGRERGRLDAGGSRQLERLGVAQVEKRSDDPVTATGDEWPQAVDRHAANEPRENVRNGVVVGMAERDACVAFTLGQRAECNEWPPPFGADCVKARAEQTREPTRIGDSIRGVVGIGVDRADRNVSDPEIVLREPQKSEHTETRRTAAAPDEHTIAKTEHSPVSAESERAFVRGRVSMRSGHPATRSSDKFELLAEHRWNLLRLVRRRAERRHSMRRRRIIVRASRCRRIEVHAVFAREVKREAISFFLESRAERDTHGLQT
jgi:hypothetical protein